MKLRLEKIRYEKYNWKVCGDLSVIFLSVGLQLGYTKSSTLVRATTSICVVIQCADIFISYIGRFSVVSNMCTKMTCTPNNS